MPQCDVHRAPMRMRQRAPFLVVAQSARLDQMKTRVVIPLIEAPASGVLDEALAPGMTIEGRTLILAPWEIFTIPAVVLGTPIASLADDGPAMRIIAAIDELITRAYG